VKGKLFTPMFTTKAKGQGFGLAVIKRMTGSLGGTVTFQSQEGKGTTFILRCPNPHNKKLSRYREPDWDSTNSLLIEKRVLPLPKS